MALRMDKPGDLVSGAELAPVPLLGPPQDTWPETVQATRVVRPTDRTVEAGMAAQGPALPYLRHLDMKARDLVLQAADRLVLQQP